MIWRDTSRLSPYSGQQRLPSWLGQPFHAPPVVPLWDPQPIAQFVGHDSNLQRIGKGIYGEELRNPLVLHCNFAYSGGGLVTGRAGRGASEIQRKPFPTLAMTTGPLDNAISAECRQTAKDTSPAQR
jgi:hypothetical protein